MTEIVILDRVFNGYRMEYTNKIYDYHTITQYIQDSLLHTLKYNNLYNLLPNVLDLKFKIYKTRDSDDIIYAESINKYVDYSELYTKCLDEIDEFKKIIEFKNGSIECLEIRLKRVDEFTIKSLLNENIDIKDSLDRIYNESKIISKENDRLKNKTQIQQRKIYDLEEQVINEKYRYNYLL